MSLPQRRISIAQHGPVDRLYSRECHVFLHGRVQWVQPDLNGTKRCGENCLQNAHMQFLLHCDALWVEECRCKLFKLRMNPLKCAFGVSTGKFLGFLIHNKGIDVEPTKATAIATMKPLTTVKELKSFLGKISYI